MTVSNYLATITVIIVKQKAVALYCCGFELKFSEHLHCHCYFSVNIISVIFVTKNWSNIVSEEYVSTEAPL